jgi:uncharacterized protein
MTDLRKAAAEFLAHRRLAVAGVARDGSNPANLIYRRLRADGYHVVPLNPSATRVEGDPCYRTVGEIPGGVDGVIIATPPAAAASVVADCAAAGVERVWLHRSVGDGSVSGDAVALCHQHRITVLPGGCPMMFLEPVDVGHRCMRWILGVTGKLPEPVAYHR